MTNKILLVEDNAIAQRVAQFIIRSCGDEPTVVESGLEALRKANEEHFDLIIMDIGLPDVDGYTVRETLKGAGINTPVFGLTAHYDILEENVFTKPLTRKLYQNMRVHCLPEAA